MYKNGKSKDSKPQKSTCLVGRKHLASNTNCLLFCPPMLSAFHLTSASSGFHLQESGGWLAFPAVHSQFIPFPLSTSQQGLCGLELPIKKEDRESLLEQASLNCPVPMEWSTGDEPIIQNQCIQIQWTLMGYAQICEIVGRSDSQTTPYHVWKVSRCWVQCCSASSSITWMKA